jgi:hypothetical protein
MAITPKIDDLEKLILKKENLSYRDLSILELGNQGRGKQIPAKRVYLQRGVIEHVSIDLNGFDDSLKIDLDKELPEEFHNKFNLITNYGTTEHVNNQYSAFSNINKACVLGELMIHALVLPNNWPKHGRYYYPEDFSSKLASLFGYKIIHFQKFNPYNPPKTERDLIMVCFKKRCHNDVSNSQFQEIPILDSGNMKQTGDYIKKRKRRK